MHLVEVAMLVWFWLTPIVYQFERPYQALSDHGLGWLMLCNPLTITTIAMQRLFYGRSDVPSPTGNGMKLIPDESVLWYLGITVFALAVGLAALGLAVRFFARREGDLAEDI
jgi:ABC-2 type transport system permease protein